MARPEGEGLTSPATVHALVEQQAAQRPQAPYALAAEVDASISFGELARHCRSVWTLLQRHGVRAGDTVSLVMPNGLNTLRLLLGAMWGGARVHPVNLLAQPEQMRYVLDHADGRLVVASPDWAERVQAMAAGLARPVAVVVADPDALSLPDEGAAEALSVESPDPQATALLMYTSGTTGLPKGVMLSQASLVANARAIAAEHALAPADRVMAVLPLYHINAFVVTMLAPLASGGSLVIAPKFSAGRYWPQVLQHHCSWLNVVPTIVSFLLEGEADAPEREALSHIRLLRSASAALPVEHLLAFEQRFGIGVVETMGLTETAAPAFSNPLDPAQRKPGAVGRASGCEARVIDAQLQSVADGQTGEVALRGPNVMQGYYKNDAATAATFTPDGWLRTGDLGHRDADGFFYITGRIKELIIKGGENIAPREIDEVLLRHAMVLDAAAVGMPDKHYGQDILACVVLRSGVDPAEAEASIRGLCEQQLGRYKSPKTIRFVDALPRGPSGKVQRLKLLDG